MLIADVGVETTRKIIANLTEGASRKQLKDAEALYGLLKDEMGEILAKVDEPLNIEGKTPFVILMVGVNGVGKTTTIGKLARQFEQQGKSVMLAAGILSVRRRSNSYRSGDSVTTFRLSPSIPARTPPR